MPFAEKKVCRYYIRDADRSVSTKISSDQMKIVKGIT
jgi:hypothetical protein